MDCCKDVQGVIGENAGVEVAYKATSQAILAMLVCTVSRQESKEAGGQRCIVRYSKQNKTDFEYQYKNSGLELKLHINFIFFHLDARLHVVLCLVFVNKVAMVLPSKEALQPPR